MLQQDTIQASYAGGSADSVTTRQTLTPGMVIKWLPRDATPAQQDSIVQAHFQPSEIRWSNRPDTLHLPGHDKGHNMLDVNIPQYYREGFFSKDSMFHPELPGGRYGVVGDPVPYTVHGDNIITALLLGCFIMAVLAFTNARGFIVRQAKNFFYAQREGFTEVSETANELRFQAFLVVLTCLLVSLLYYFYTVTYVGDTFVLQSDYHLIAIYLGIAVGYYVLKMLLYTTVNLVFFDGKRNVQWLKSFLFITSVEGVLIFPAVMLLAYFDVSVEMVLKYLVIVLVVVKLLTIYKCFLIFFRQNVVKLQIILYFCTLEMIPLLALWGALVITADNLKINF